MTVPGKGGRPRKWRSDADRVRAFRARQRGELEPPALTVALDNGDELAAAWEQVRHLGEQLYAQRTLERSARREATEARRRLDAEMRRFVWLEAANDDLRSRNADLERQEAALRDELANIAEENRALHHQLEVASSAKPTALEAPVARSANRAQRRRATKAARRKR